MTRIAALLLALAGPACWAQDAPTGGAGGSNEAGGAPVAGDTGAVGRAKPGPPAPGPQAPAPAPPSRRDAETDVSTATTRGAAPGLRGKTETLSPARGRR